MIPKIIHQLWIGPKSPPSNHMATWKNKNPSFEYIRWSEDELKKRNFNLECTDKINEIEEINGKADIIRWEILYEYGGVFIDADSVCVEPIDDILMSKEAFAGWEQEVVRPGLVATGTMGFPPKHPLVRNAIDFILRNEVSQKKTKQMAWQTVGPGLLTKLNNTGFFKDLYIFPSFTFLPIHCTKKEYNGHGKIYAFQEWGSTFNNYESMDQHLLPNQLITPDVSKSISILISSYNTKAAHIKACLHSIKNQVGHFHMEIVWINDGSDSLHSSILKKMLDQFKLETRFTSIVYSENMENKGIGFTLNKGINLCSNEIIIKMDSDDVMVPDRIIKQFTYMNENPNVHICGGQMKLFQDTREQQIVNVTNHPSLSWDNYKKNPSHWFINHPTVCYRKSSVLKVGNYNAELKEMSEDFELELRMLKEFKYIYNFSDYLLFYRLHSGQITHKLQEKGTNIYWTTIRNKIISNLINDK